MNYVISGPTRPVQDTIYIPSSKSISNRVLIMRHLAGSTATLENLSVSDDTSLLVKALGTKKETKDVGHAGTAMRFLAGMYSVLPGNVVLTGSARMKQRPIGPLVEALRELGAGIDYLETDGCPPIKIRGGGMKGGTIRIDGGISSQFISSLMMVGPLLRGGLEIILEGRVVSASYIRMTLELMKSFGVGVAFDGKVIRISGGAYHMVPVHVESDWSAASYWYQVAALSPGAVIRLPHLLRESLQGDSMLVPLFESLGVTTTFRGETATLSSVAGTRPDFFVFDFTESPDLVQTCAAACCALGVPFNFCGTETLRVKETDRIEALTRELGKLGYLLDHSPDGEWISWEGARKEPDPVPEIDTYHDHRMAMAFAPLALTHKQLEIRDPMVVTKSYPTYWDDMRKAGFGIRIIREN